MKLIGVILMFMGISGITFTSNYICRTIESPDLLANGIMYIGALTVSLVGLAIFIKGFTKHA